MNTVLYRKRAPMDGFNTRFNAGLRLASLLRASIDLDPKKVKPSYKRKLFLDAYIGMCFHHHRWDSGKSYKIDITLFAEKVWTVTCNGNMCEIVLTTADGQVIQQFDHPSLVTEVFDGIFKEYVANAFDLVEV